MGYAGWANARQQDMRGMHTELQQAVAQITYASWRYGCAGWAITRQQMHTEIQQAVAEITYAS